MFMRRFLQSRLELFEENERKNLAIFTGHLSFSQGNYSGLPPETVFQPLLKDNLVSKGIGSFIYNRLLRCIWLIIALDDLISILKTGEKWRKTFWSSSHPQSDLLKVSP
ncbi:hypothetical protein NC653_030070 [Populus alba x Populus x berolinensis]|uniref:5MP1/2-like HEAT domain-containing protein n=1 Tax=Populus alba x Populus x berolinensis TaxID=444605 RepID=A0AAD6LWE3_9ROSI|nr:hypothetical protein NC653_030070 [Populus alba x Populus x berolinensis]